MKAEEVWARAQKVAFENRNQLCLVLSIKASFLFLSDDSVIMGKMVIPIPFPFCLSPSANPAFRLCIAVIVPMARYLKPYVLIWEYPDWCPADWCRPIDADLLMPTFWCQSLLMPVPFDAQQARLMPDPIDVGLIHALSSKQFHFETLLRPGPIDARPSWCQLSLLMPVPIDARPHWCPFRLV